MLSACAAVFVLLTVVHGNDDNPSIQTAAGVLEGKIVTSHNGKSVEAYLGIPYGQPPVGNLRFSPPVPIQAWDGIRSAQKFGHECPQPDLIVPGRKSNVYLDKSEDCLYLNVWTSHPRPENAAVLVFFHGFHTEQDGTFRFGSGAAANYDGAQLADEQSLIVVTANYRFSELGFLYLGVPEAPGNVGLMDQALVLKWVQENVAGFGGDPSKVTAFGDDVGALFLGLQLIIPTSKNLFRNVILLDGFPTIRDLAKTKEHSLKMASKLSGAIGCSNDTTNATKILNCLRTRTVKDLILTSFREIKPEGEFFSPVIDGVYLPDNPSVLLKQGAFIQRMNAMIGTTYHKGSRSYHFVLHQPLEDHSYINYYQFQSMIKVLTGKSTGLARKALADVYTDWENPTSPKSIRHNAIDLMTDSIYICPASNIAQQLTVSGNDVYFFHFTQRVAKARYPEWAGLLESEVIDFIFGHAHPNRNYTEKEHQFSHSVMEYLGNFVRTGNPNPKHQGLWQRYNLREKPYLEVKIGAKLKHHLKTKKCAFFNRGYKRLLAADELISDRCH